MAQTVSSFSKTNKVSVGMQPFHVKTPHQVWTRNWFLGLTAAASLSLFSCSQQTQMKSTFLKSSAISMEDRNPSNSNLGESNSIIGGESVDLNDPIAKATVALYLPFRGGKVANFCTGTLVAKDLVLTAAHCFVDSSREINKSGNGGISITPEQFASYVLIGFGTKIVDTWQNQQDVMLIKVMSVRIHPKYDPEALNRNPEKVGHDLALVKLSQNAPTSAVVAAMNLDSGLLKKGTPLVLAGFGTTKVSPETIIQDGEPMTTVKRTPATQLMKVSVLVDNPLYNDSQFTYTVTNGKSSCSGDSGGPAFIQTKTGSLMTVGVTSWGDGLCSKLGAYTSIAAEADWVNQSATELESLSLAPIAVSTR